MPEAGPAVRVFGTGPESRRRLSRSAGIRGRSAGRQPRGGSAQPVKEVTVRGSAGVGGDGAAPLSDDRRTGSTPEAGPAVRAFGTGPESRRRLSRSAGIRGRSAGRQPRGGSAQPVKEVTVRGSAGVGGDEAALPPDDPPVRFGGCDPPRRLRALSAARGGTGRGRRIRASGSPGRPVAAGRSSRGGRSGGGAGAGRVPRSARRRGVRRGAEPRKRGVGGRLTTPGIGARHAVRAFVRRRGSAIPVGESRGIRIRLRKTPFGLPRLGMGGSWVRQPPDKPGTG